MAPEAGIEPATNRLTADRSTAELLRSVAILAVLPPSLPTEMRDLANFEC